MTPVEQVEQARRMLALLLGAASALQNAIDDAVLDADTLDAVVTDARSAAQGLDDLLALAGPKPTETLRCARFVNGSGKRNAANPGPREPGDVCQNCGGARAAHVAGNQPPLLQPLSVVCPTCLSGPTEPCQLKHAIRGEWARKVPHAARLQAARKLNGFGGAS